MKKIIIFFFVFFFLPVNANSHVTHYQQFKKIEMERTKSANGEFTGFHNTMGPTKQFQLPNWLD